MYTLILNPTSGRGAAQQRLGEIEALLQQRKIEYCVQVAQSPMEATNLAAAAAGQKLEGIIAIGGDGTLFQIANGVAGSDVPVLFVACGTGNDFVRVLNLPKDPIEALKLQLDSSLRRIDIGKMNDIHFLNVSGTGFDVDVLRYAEKYKQKFGGLTAYVRALMDALKFYKPTTAMISMDGGEEIETQFTILSVGNGRYFGGGMKAVPDAVIDDGLFDVVIVRPVKLIAIPVLLAFYIAGKHVALKLGKAYRCKTLTVRRNGMTVNLDGELRDTDYAKYELLPGALRVRLP